MQQKINRFKIGWFFDKAGDIVRSWFGYERADRLRNINEIRNRDYVRNWGGRDNEGYN